MSRFAPSVDSPSDRSPRSRLAVASLVCSAIICCPPASAVGIGLAVVALLRIARSPVAMRGRGLAIAALFLGAFGVLAQSLLLREFEESYSGRLEEAMLADLETAFIASMAADADAVRRIWASGRDRPSGEAISDFGTALNDRYGGFRAVTIVRKSSSGSFTSPAMTVALTMTFERRTLVGAAEFLLVPAGGSLHPQPRLRSIEIEDSQSSDLSLP